MQNLRVFLLNISVIIFYGVLSRYLKLMKNKCTSQINIMPGKKHSQREELLKKRFNRNRISNKALNDSSVTERYYYVKKSFFALDGFFKCSVPFIFSKIKIANSYT